MHYVQTDNAEILKQYDSEFRNFSILHKEQLDIAEAKLDALIRDQQTDIKKHTQNQPGRMAGAKKKEAWQQEASLKTKSLENLKKQKTQLIEARKPQKMLEAFREKHPELTSERDRAAREMREQSFDKSYAKKEQEKEQAKEKGERSRSR